MQFNRKRYALFVSLGLLSTYLFTRLYSLLVIPIFTDEAIYVRWAQLFNKDIHRAFISLNDGKQPLFIWVGAAFMHLFNDPLVAVRLVSVATGLLTLTGLYLLTRELFNKKIAVAACCLYIIYPFSLVYDRLALYDSMLATLAVWALYGEVLLVRLKKFYIALFVGVIIGAGLLTKSSAFFFLYLLPFSLLLFNFKSKTKSRDLIKWTAQALFVTVVALSCYSILRLSHNYHYIADKNNVFVYPLSEWIKHPFSLFVSNIHSLGATLIDYATLPLLLLVIIAFFVDRHFTRQKLLLLAWFVMPFIALALFAKLLSPRYILFMTMPLLVLAAFAITHIAEKFKPLYLKVAICAIFVCLMLGKDYFILTDFAKAKAPALDHAGFIAGYASGVGVEETIEFLRAASQHQKIYVGTQGVFGLMPEALQIYFDDDPNVQIEGLLMIGNNPPQEILDAASKMPTYFVFYADCQVCGKGGTAPSDWHLKQVFQISRLDKSLYTLYEVPSN
jgi:4-amino-4-deoxy-L-arabinose transferase-like glycosyltransferase